MWYPILLTVFVGYLLGNLNGSVSISMLRNDDVRSHGSGNAGLTNFVRSYGLGSAALVLLIDVGKAAAACLAGGMMLGQAHWPLGVVLGGIAVTLGHDFPALLGFRGGKGILCGITIAAILDWQAALMILGVFLLFFLASGYVSLGSVFGALTLAVSLAIRHWGNFPVALGCIFLGALAVFMHRGNIVRLCRGTEKKISFTHKEKKS